MKIKLMTMAMSLITATGISQATFTSKNDIKSVAKFESEAPLETIVGIGNNVNAKVTLNLNDINQNPTGLVSVDLNSLKTGIEMRDKDMREDFLNTEKFPTAEFNLTGFSNVSSKELTDGIKVTAIANGKLTIHGTTKEISTPVILFYFKDSERTKNRMKGNLLSVTTSFTIKLSDYDIKVPAMLFYKLENLIKISVAFIASDSEG